MKRQVQDTNAYRLIDLTRQRNHDLKAGETWSPVDGVRLTLPLGEDRILLEILDDALEGDVVADGHPVFDISTLGPMAELKIGDSEYVVLESLAAYVRRDIDNDTRRSSVTMVAQSPVDTQVPAKQTLAETTIQKEKKTASRPRRKLALFAICAVFASASLAATFLSQEGPNQLQTVETPSLQTMSNEKDLIAVEKKQNAEPAVKAALPPVSTDEIAESPHAQADKSTPIIKETTPKENTSAKDAALLSPAPKPQSGSQRKKATSPAVTPKLNPVDEKSFREALESYRLEAGFDPENAMKNLQSLSEKIPHGTSLRNDIDQAIQEVRNRL